MLTLNTKLSTLPRFTKKYTDTLKKLNIETVEDFLFHFPFRYEDYTERVLIDDLSAGQQATIMGHVAQSKLIRTWKKRMLITEAWIEDESGTVRAVWFNQPYVSDSLTEGKGVRLSGKVSQDAKGTYFSNPSWELSSREPTNTGRLVPIYPETEGLTSRWIRWQMQNIFKLGYEISDPIPKEKLDELKLPSLKQALAYVHFPKSDDEFELGRKRFAFGEMLTVQLVSQQVKASWQNERAAVIPFDEAFTKSFVASLPFTLTNAQRKSSFQIFKDLEKGVPMNRLLNGDVGSGKTLVAAMAAMQAMHGGFQVALMAPTEVLAQQHYVSLCKVFEKYDFTIGLLTNAYKQIKSQKSKVKISSQNSKKIREELIQELSSGNIDLIIGTHALIQKDVRFKNLALVIVDEQHRFGVAQRAYLQKEITEINDGLPGKIPHLLSMTATPIPRTLSLAYFGNLDLSLLDEMPKNRKPIITELVRNRDRQRVYDFVRDQIAQGRQTFFILPLVEESKVLTEVKAATQEHERLSKEIFPDLSLGLLHGKLKSQDKDAVMKDFKEKKYDILVATSVVEVGIDVPNATVIVIEDADRFGLSQLHQFRGRVGRGEHQSYCFLMTASSTEKARSRLSALVKHQDGFTIAEHDLKMRGPGEFLGSRQSGLPDISMEHLANVRLIEITKDYAQELLSEDPDLKKHPLLKHETSKFTQNVHLE